MKAPAALYECIKNILYTHFFYYYYHSVDGFSSKLQHEFNDEYSGCAFSETPHGSFLESTSKEEHHICEHLELKKRVWAYPAVFASPESELHLVSAEEVFLKPSTVAEVRKNNFPPQAALIPRSKHNLQEESDEPLPKTTAIKQEQPDVEARGEVRSAKMDTRRKPGKPKFPRLVRQKGKGGKKAGKNCNCLCSSLMHE